MSDAAPVVWLIDDDAAVRKSLALLLTADGIRSRCCASAAEFLDVFEPSLPGCIVVDVLMPRMTGLELQTELACRGAATPLIVITGHGTVPTAVAALKAGAFDFLEKPFDDRMFIATVRRGLEADRLRRHDDARLGRLRRRYATLTVRERQVLELIIAGHPNKVIAARLSLSQRTVEIHRARVMDKMAARSLSELVQHVVALKPALDAATPPDALPEGEDSDGETSLPRRA